MSERHYVEPPQTPPFRLRIKQKQERFCHISHPTWVTAAQAFAFAGNSCKDRSDRKKKGRPRLNMQELRTIPAHMMIQWKEEFRTRTRVKCPSPGCWLEFPSIYGLKYHYQRCQGETIEKLSHGCPYCEAAFATKLRLRKHKLWNHPEKVSMESTATVNMKFRAKPKAKLGLQKDSIKVNVKRRPTEISPHCPVPLKMKKTQKMSQSFQNREYSTQMTDKSQQQLRTLSEAGKCVPTTFSEEHPERMKHRRKQKMPKKFTGEQPSISGTFGLKGISKVEEKLKAGRTKGPEGASFNKESQRKQQTRKEMPFYSQMASLESQRQEPSEEYDPNCSSVTNKAIPGITKHNDMWQKTPISKEVKLDSSKGKEKEESQAENVKLHTVQKKSLEKNKHRNEEMSEKKKKNKVEAEEDLLDLERTPSGRVRRRSAQVAVFHLQEIAEDELAKDWGTKRRIKDDLVPDIKRLNYTRPGLPNYNAETVETWKNEVKDKGFICCPNSSCEAIYSSVSGLKAHLASCIKGGGVVGKYTCLLCQKEFSSESGVKYHIGKIHCQNWFRASDHVPDIKSKELPRNNLQRGMKNGVPLKRRGRKPKEHMPETASFPEMKLSSTHKTTPPATSNQIPSSETSLTPSLISNQDPACTTFNNIPSSTDGVIQMRHLQPPFKKRIKPKKVQLKE
ncbi:zinc finger protein 512B [Trichomycterus rosablanca]|uniref:zinc finger protein 512B n=1 Tax=Trichomycterus rosablanca TaxID=2290929 RepID=UPI002F35F551